MRLVISEKGSNVNYDHHSIQINLDLFMEDWWFDEIQAQISDENIYREYPLNADGEEDANEEYGLEKNPHVTVLYGLTSREDLNLIDDYINILIPFQIYLGKVSAFRATDSLYDVLKVNVESDELHSIHKFLRETFNNDFKFPVYGPHATLAYVKKGACVGMEGIEINKTYLIDELEWCDPNGERYILPLMGDTIEESMKKKKHYKHEGFFGFRVGDMVRNNRTGEIGTIVHKLDKNHYCIEIIDERGRISYETWSPMSLSFEKDLVYGY